MSVVAQRANTSGALAALAGDLTTPSQGVRTAGASGPVLATPVAVIAIAVATLVAASSCDGGMEIE